MAMIHAILWMTPECASETGRAKPETTMTDVSQLPKSRKELRVVGRRSQYKDRFGPLTPPDAPIVIGGKVVGSGALCTYAVWERC